MGAIVVSLMVSVDGYSEGPGGDLSAMTMDAGFNRHNAALTRTAASFLMGATTFRGMVGYWPTAVDDPDDDTRSIARRYADGLPVTVVSDTLTTDDTGPWREQTTIVGRAELADAVARLRAQEGETVVFGSRTLVGALLAQGMVDELHLMVGPRIVAGDAPVFAGVPATDLRLLDVRQFEDSGNVVLHYAVGAS